MTERFDLCSARLNKGLTQRELSDRTHVPLQTIQRLEAGLGAHPSNAKRVADFFRVKVTDLMPLERSDAAA